MLHYAALFASIAYFSNLFLHPALNYIHKLEISKDFENDSHHTKLKSFGFSFSESLKTFNDQNYLQNYVCDKNHSFIIKITKRDPLFMEIENFLGEGEAEHLVSIALPLMTRSTVAGYAESEQRTSSTAFLEKSGDPVLLCIEERASELINQPIGTLEGLQVVKYVNGQRYDPHHDYFHPDHPSSESELRRGGQRTVTLFVYLNTVHESDGGKTYFPDLDYGVQPEKNKASLWYNIDVNNKEDSRTLHTGSPVAEGAEKYGLNVWFRQGAFK